MRRLTLEVIRRPEAGITGADDGDVRLQVFTQRGARAQRLLKLIHPQANRAPVSHGVSPLNIELSAEYSFRLGLVVRAGTQGIFGQYLAENYSRVNDSGINSGHKKTGRLASTGFLFTRYC
ncbi:conserved protein of unknown function [Pseudomonas marincola]|uniref:Uncharacterized protein n=1 Tax=Pseudomonas marincola TaxID=437900 RepID=A0A653E630_9PSED|nr:conserved protein of unknown function [Pseudomonas marincola]